MTKERVMTRAVLPILVLVSACGQGAEQPQANSAGNAAANQAAANAAQPAAAAVPSLVGEWTITSINGRAPDQIWPMVARVTADSFTIQSECRRMAWTFRQDRNVIQLAPDPGSSTDCARVRSPAELMIEKPVGLANIAMFGSDGREVELTGPGGRVTMTRR